MASKWPSATLTLRAKADSPRSQRLSPGMLVSRGSSCCGSSFAFARSLWLYVTDPSSPYFPLKNHSLVGYRMYVKILRVDSS